jgi:hypothetical protein
MGESATEVLKRKLSGSVILRVNDTPYTAKTKCQKFETNIPRKGISGPVPRRLFIPALQ